MKFEEVKFKNPGALIADIPQDIWAKLSESIDSQIAKKDTLKNLKKVSVGIGGVSENFRFICPEELLTFSKEFIIAYREYFAMKPMRNFTLVEAWINLQKKYDYRPTHTHFGDLSFVIWYKIPYLLKDEDSYGNTTGAYSQTNGRFQFNVQKLSGEVYSHYINADTSYEGKMLLFDSKIQHAVLPYYTSDELRISVAGNFVIE